MMRRFENGNLNLNVVLDENNELLFFGKEIAEILGYVNTRKAIERHVDVEDKMEFQDLQGGQLTDLPCGGLQPRKILINETGFYSLVFQSRLPQAREFRRWVLSEVLPQIRKTGSYSLNTGLLKLKDISTEDVEKMSADEKKAFKKEMKKFSELLKDPVQQEKGRHGGTALWRKIKEKEELYEELQKKLTAIELILGE